MAENDPFEAIEADDRDPCRALVTAVESGAMPLAEAIIAARKIGIKRGGVRAQEAVSEFGKQLKVMSDRHMASLQWRG